MSEIAVVEVKPQLVAGMQRRGQYAEIATLFTEIYPYAASKGAKFVGPPFFILHEQSKEESKKADAEGTALVDVAVPIATPIEESDAVKCYELPGGTMAKTVYKGPYEQCEPTYDALFKWIYEQGYTIAGSIRESYLNSPEDVPPEELLTEIYVPVAKA